MQIHSSYLRLFKSMSDIIGPSLQGSGGGLSNLDSRYKKHLGLLELRQSGGRCGLEKACHSTGSRDLAEAARDEVCAVDIRNSMGGGGNWRNRGVIGYQLGEKGIKSEINLF